jgi:hypothetical protein
MEITMFIGPLAGAAPALIFWIAVIVFAVIMLRRDGDRAECFLIAGASLKIVSNLLNIPVGFIHIWLIDKGYSVDSAVSIVSSWGIFLNVISMAGIICLIYAFWVKFKGRNFEEVKEGVSPPLQTSPLGEKE